MALLQSRRHLPRLLACARTTPFRAVRYNSSPAAAAEPATSPRTVPSFFTPATGDLKPFFVTTPIFYVNASPHIGHLHSVVLTDVFARFARLRHPQREVVFCTGTDEHGLKIQQAAAKAGISEHAFCDDVSQRFRDLSDKANISYTDFIRTSEPRHYRAVEAFWDKLVKSGDIYKGRHEGWYSVSDECFYSNKQVESKDGEMIALETGNVVTWQEEENWKFKLSNHADKLEKWLENEESVSPPQYRADILKQVRNATELSISRPASRVKWGVPVPGDPNQTIYVWVDALINYITVAGYPGAHAAWPPEMHLVGKDIIRFHALHWPALLSAAGEELPKRVMAHAHWTMGKAKMSKSRGNVADPIAAMDKYGVDGVRWYLMRAGGALADDADYSDEELGNNYARLKDQVGNLVGRIGSRGLLKKVGDWKPEDRDASMDALLSTFRDSYETRFEAYELTQAASSLIGLIEEGNRFFTAKKPWSVDDGTAAIVYAYNALRLVGILAQPIMPSKAVELLDRLGVPADERSWEHATWNPETVNTQQMVERIAAASKSFAGTSLFPPVEEEKVKVTNDVEKARAEAKVAKEKQRAEAKARREQNKKKATENKETAEEKNDVKAE